MGAKLILSPLMQAAVHNGSKGIAKANDGKNWK